MSIERTGPAKYRYQDRVAALFALEYLNKQNCEVLNDPKGVFEDIVIRFYDGDILHAFEVQVKEVQRFTLKDLVECLLHFGDRQSDLCLFDKLLDGKRNAIVVSGRCDDALLPFLTKISNLSNSDNSKLITREALRNIRSIIDNFCDGEGVSNLSKARREHCEQIRLRNNPALKSALTNLRIIDSIDESDVLDHTIKILASEHSIPHSIASDVADKMFIAARTSVEEKIDLVPGVGRIVSSYSQRKYGIEGYVEWGNEEKWLDILMKENALLLSGVPRCGKSSSGKRILDILGSKGFKVEFLSDLDQAAAFLNSDETVCVLLEDPFGNRGIAEEDNDRRLTKLKKLFRLVDSRRKLIICQSQDELFQAMGVESLSRCRLAGKNWFDLSHFPEGFLLSVWKGLYENLELPDELYGIVNKLLSSGTVIEPGALDYIAYNHDFIEGDYTQENLLSVIRLDSKGLSASFAKHFDNPDLEFLSGLAFCLYSAHTIQKEDLAFILTDMHENDVLPGVKSSLGQAFSLGDSLVKTSLDYTQEYSLSEAVDDLLFTLKRRRLISDDDNRIAFTHSFYKAAAEFIIYEVKPSSWDRISDYCKRALGCKSPVISKSVAKGIVNLSTLVDDPKGRKQLVKLAFDTRHSRFPATYHCVISYIYENLDLLDDEDRKDFLNNPESLQVSLFNAEWSEGEAWTPDNISMFRRYDPIGIDNIAAKAGEWAEAFASPKNVLPSSEEATALLKYYQQENIDVSAEIVLGIMIYDLALLRVEATKMWLEKGRNSDDEILKLIFNDEMPIVVAAAYKMVIEQVHVYSGQRVKLLKEYLLASASNELNTIVLLKAMADVEFPLNDMQNKLLLSLLITVLASKARLHNFDSAKLYYVLRGVSEQCSAEELLPLFAAWDKRIDKWISDGISDDYTLAIAKLLIPATDSNPSIRQDLSEKLLSQSNTPALMVLLGDYINNWEHLTDHEKRKIMNTLISGRADQHWLQARALTRNNVPPEIQELLLGDSLFFGQDPADIVTNMNSCLLACCVKIYCGQPQPLWYYGGHHCNPSLWEPVLLVLGNDIKSPLFRYALAEFVFQGDSAAVCEMFDANTGHERSFISSLLAENVRANDFKLSKAWDHIFDSVSDESLKDECFDEIASVFPRLADGLAEIRFFFNKKDYQSRLLDIFKSDRDCIELVYNLRGVLGGDFDNQKTLFVIKNFVLLSSPVFYKTYDYVVHRLDEYGFADSEERAELEKMRRKLINERHDLGGIDVEEKPIDDWSLLPC
ncbi:hypothetical protein [Maridesulfovibrio sp.]|uniref:nSTAND3 domain-containing NTPase n=1 Tax=Maridesulfovibrio sp. TaxID=2795000 RepID=UPI0039F12D45